MKDRIRAIRNRIIQELSDYPATTTLSALLSVYLIALTALIWTFPERGPVAYQAQMFPLWVWGVLFSYATVARIWVTFQSVDTGVRESIVHFSSTLVLVLWAVGTVITNPHGYALPAYIFVAMLSGSVPLVQNIIDRRYGLSPEIIRALAMERRHSEGKLKNDKGPCKDKSCGHAEMKHYLKGGGRCIVRGCPCEKYKN